MARRLSAGEATSGHGGSAAVAASRGKCSAIRQSPATAPQGSDYVRLGGDFDAELGMIDPGRVDAHEGNPQAKLRILVSVEGEDAKRLERIAEARGKKPGDVVAELLRDADRPAA
jgi:hypothetical protein